MSSSSTFSRFHDVVITSSRIRSYIVIPWNDRIACHCSVTKINIFQSLCVCVCWFKNWTNTCIVIIFNPYFFPVIPGVIVSLPSYFWHFFFHFIIYMKYGRKSICWLEWFSWMKRGPCHAIHLLVDCFFFFPLTLPEFQMLLIQFPSHKYIYVCINNIQHSLFRVYFVFSYIIHSSCHRFSRLICFVVFVTFFWHQFYNTSVERLMRKRERKEKNVSEHWTKMKKIK